MQELMMSKKGFFHLQLIGLIVVLTTVYVGTKSINNEAIKQDIAVMTKAIKKTLVDAFDVKNDPLFRK